MTFNAAALLLLIAGLALIGWLKHAGLALSIGLAACLNAGLLYRGLRQHGIYTPQPGWLAFSLKLLAALVVMGGVLWFTSGSSDQWLQWNLSTRLLRLSSVVIFGAGVYFATLWITGFRLKDFRRRAAE